MRKPTNTRVTQTAAQHGYPATDYSFQPDEWVYAPERGQITDVTLNAGDCGKRIVLTSGKTEYYMCHFQDVAVGVNQVVDEGRKLGIMGETGRANGRHLHLYIIDNGVRVADPDAWLNARIKKEDAVNKINREAVRLAYQLDGRKSNAAAEILHSTKGDAISLLKGLIKDSPKAGDQKKINDLTNKNKELTGEVAGQKVKIAQLEKALKEAGGSFTESDRQTLGAISSTVNWIKDKLTNIFK